MMYQESYILSDHNRAIFSSNVDIVITDSLQEEDHRSSALLTKLKGYKGLILLLSSKDNYQSFSYTLKQNGEIIDKSLNSIPIIPQYFKLLNSLNLTTKSVLLDITSMRQALIFYSISVFVKEIKTKLFFVSYTQPKKYERKNLPNLKDSEEPFDLIEMFKGSSSPVPGFIKKASKKDKLLIVSLGFDKKRFVAINESTNPKEIYPIFGFPSYKPGWDQIALKLNSDTLLRYDVFDNAKNCLATSPFDIINTLKELELNWKSQYDIYLCPIGPRPHLLGMALYAALNNTYIVYDFPLEKKFGSQGSGKTYIYHLTNLI